MNLCETVYSIEEIKDTVFSYNYKGKNSLFICNNSEYIINPDIRIEKNLGDKNIYFWFKKDLFFEMIDYWIEFTKIEINGNKILLEFRTINTGVDKIKRPKIKGIVELIRLSPSETFEVIDKRIKIE